MTTRNAQAHLFKCLGQKHPVQEAQWLDLLQEAAAAAAGDGPGFEGRTVGYMWKETGKDKNFKRFFFVIGDTELDNAFGRSISTFGDKRTTKLLVYKSEELALADCQDEEEALEALRLEGLAPSDLGAAREGFPHAFKLSGTDGSLNKAKHVFACDDEDAMLEWRGGT